MRCASFLLLLFGMIAPAGVAMAQAPKPVESVTVTGTKSREVLRGFIQSFAAPTRLTGKLARWDNGICPVTTGLRPEFVKFIERRLKDIAVQVGAPVNGNAACKPNIAIVFTTKPQALLDHVKNEQPSLLGYYDNMGQRDQLATVTRPIQAWYMTVTQDLHGKPEVDSGRTRGEGLVIWLPCPQPPGICRVVLPNAHAAAVTGNRMRDGLRSNLYNVVIVADPTRLASYEIGALSDYIAMLALTQLSSLDRCQQLPSIVNLLAQGCETKADALTDNDLGYLRGLYQMSADTNLNTQEDEIAYQMGQGLKGR